MYKYIDFTQLEGLPLTQNTLKLLQDGYRETVVGIATLLGDNVIISGVADLGANYGDGWVVIGGELLPFIGGVKADYIVTETTATGKIYADGATRNAWYTKVAKSGVAGGVLHTSFVRLDTLITQKNEIADLKKRKVISDTKGVDYTLVLTDANKNIIMDVAGANEVTVPANASVAFEIGTQILITQKGAGQTSVTPDSGVTIRSGGGLLSIAQRYTGAALLKVAANEWYLFGNLGA